MKKTFGLILRLNKTPFVFQTDKFYSHQNKPNYLDDATLADLKEWTKFGK